jgi:hypothetical protein
VSAAHTPGPLEAGELAAPAYAPQFGIYARGTIHPLAIVMGDRAEADVVLFAAAPELLRELKIAERFMRGFEGDEVQKGVDARLAGMRAAIAKAEGRS